MSLRNRLWLVVGALVLVPLMVGGIVTVAVVDQAAADRTRRSVSADATSVVALLTAACQQAALAARSLGAEATAGSPAAAVRSVVAAGYADYAAVLDPAGKVLAAAGTPPGPGADAGSCSRGEAPHGAIAEQVPVAAGSGAEAGVGVVARGMDSAAVAGLVAGRPEATLTLVDADGGVVASTLPAGTARAMAAAAAAAGTAAGGTSRLTVGQWLAEARAPSGGSPFTVVTATPRPDSSPLARAVLAAVLLVGALTLVLGWTVSRQLTRPLAAVTAAAERVAEGDLDQTLPVRRGDEIGRLAAAFNHMTAELRRSVTALERSRDDLRHSLERLGGALGSTHDLSALLQVVLDTAVATAGTAVGAAWAADGAGPPLQLAAVHGPAGELPDRLVGGTGAELLARAVESGQLERADGRVAVPLLRGSRVVGLLCLEDAPGGDPDPDTDEALRTLARQAGIAVDNVLLHREAERLSITDPLTGLWNFRYLSISLAREIERSARFRRPLSVLMLDIDHFKAVNDTYGHARGDAVLKELAARLGEQVREVDAIARYGGEEFVLVLPETNLDGATRLAERICAAVRRHPFAGDGEPPLPVTVSVGVAAYPEHGASPATLMRAADAALYRAKRGGRDRWEAAEA